MSYTIRSSMSTIPDDKWELAFGKKEKVNVKDNVQAKKTETEIDEDMTNEC